MLSSTANGQFQSQQKYKITALWQCRMKQVKKQKRVDEFRLLKLKT
jgi:hypothetical protein